MQGTLKLVELETPPPGGGFITVMVSGPALDTALAGTSAVIRPPLTNAVGRLLPFHCTAELGMKFEPITLNLNPIPPCLLLFGEVVTMEGTGLGFVGGALDWPPPPQPFRPSATASTPAMSRGRTSILRPEPRMARKVTR